MILPSTISLTLMILDWMQASHLQPRCPSNRYSNIEMDSNNTKFWRRLFTRLGHLYTYIYIDTSLMCMYKYMRVYEHRYMCIYVYIFIRVYTICAWTYGMYDRPLGARTSRDFHMDLTWTCSSVSKSVKGSGRKNCHRFLRLLSYYECVSKRGTSPPPKIHH